MPLLISRIVALLGRGVLLLDDRRRRRRRRRARPGRSRTGRPPPDRMLTARSRRLVLLDERAQASRPRSSGVSPYADHDRAARSVGARAPPGRPVRRAPVPSCVSWTASTRVGHQLVDVRRRPARAGGRPPRRAAAGSTRLHGGQHVADHAAPARPGAAPSWSWTSSGCRRRRRGRPPSARYAPGSLRGWSPHSRRSSTSQVWPVRSCPKLWCGSSPTSRKPAAS